MLTYIALVLAVYQLRAHENCCNIYDKVACNRYEYPAIGWLVGLSVDCRVGLAFGLSNSSSLVGVLHQFSGLMFQWRVE